MVCVCISERETRRTEWPTEYRHMQSPPERKTSTERERERWVRETKVTKMETGRETGRTVK